jgi:hypothetical protein
MTRERLQQVCAKFRPFIDVVACPCSQVVARGMVGFDILALQPMRIYVFSAHAVTLLPCFDNACEARNRRVASLPTFFDCMTSWFR